MGARFSAPVQTGLGIHPASCTIGTGSLPGVKRGRDLTLTPHSFLGPWSRKNRAIQSLKVPVQRRTLPLLLTLEFRKLGKFLRTETYLKDKFHFINILSFELRAMINRWS